jgi:hypothetical protein
LNFPEGFDCGRRLTLLPPLDACRRGQRVFAARRCRRRRLGAGTGGPGSKSCKPTAQGFQGATNHCIVVRNNKLLNNAGIDVRGHTLNGVVEGNVIQNASVGVHVDTTHAHGILTVNRSALRAAKPRGSPARAGTRHFARSSALCIQNPHTKWIFIGKR